jgi:hypothetical protein
MRSRPFRCRAALATILLLLVPLGVSVSTASASATAANVTTHTPVMGPSLLNAKQLAAWYFRHSGVAPRIPAFGGHPAGDVAALAQVFIDDGKAEGVRGDMAFVQSQLETGWLGFRGSQIPPDAYNYAGLFAFDGRASLANCAHGDTAPSRCMGTPQHGALVQIQLLRSYADPSARTARGRLISAPSDRAGKAPLWEYFGGNTCPCGKLIWASASNYGLTIIKMYSQALVESGLAGARVPYAPPGAEPTSGHGYWEVTSDSVVHPEGTASFLGDPHHLSIVAPLTGGASTSDAHGYWLLGRDGGIFSYGDARFYGSTGATQLNRPVNGMERTNDNAGYWLVADDGGIFAFGDAHFFGSTGNMHLNKPIRGMARTASGKGYWLFASDGGIFSFGDAKFFGSLGGTTLSSPVVSMRRTPSGSGYWMMTADGKVFSFGAASTYGDMAGCNNCGDAARMLPSPDGKGYWIATDNGTVDAFGDATPLGFPTTVGGTPIALLSAN